MKRTTIIFVLAALMMGMVSCVESSKKYKAVVAERDSLAMVASTVSTDFESSLRTINEIEYALQTVREAENIIMMENQEGNTNYALSQIEALDRTIQQNKARIAELEQQLAASGSQSAQLNATITRLRNELNEKDTYINNLRQELNVSRTQVAELTGQVENLNENINALNQDLTNLNAQSAEQQATINQQDAALNAVYYIVAPIETLEQLGLATEGGLFSRDRANTDIDKTAMNRVDRREFRGLPLNTKKAKILTTHPESSYNLTKGADDMYSLEIVDPEAFWNTSNYLIISIK